jgi:hypothetical protein
MLGAHKQCSALLLPISKSIGKVPKQPLSELAESAMSGISSAGIHIEAVKGAQWVTRQDPKSLATSELASIARVVETCVKQLAAFEMPTPRRASGEESEPKQSTLSAAQNVVAVAFALITAVKGAHGDLVAQPQSLVYEDDAQWRAGIIGLAKALQAAVDVFFGTFCMFANGGSSEEFVLSLSDRITSLAGALGLLCLNKQGVAESHLEEAHGAMTHMYECNESLISLLRSSSTFDEKATISSPSNPAEDASQEVDLEVAKRTLKRLRRENLGSTSSLRIRGTQSLRFK